jgi:membrane fusion protein, multidrug efflux system
MRYHSIRISGFMLAVGAVALAGCSHKASESPTNTTTPVSVSYPIVRDVTDYADYTGRIAAIDSVQVRARVWGYLDKVNFKEGTLVKKDDVLFEIDPRTYKATLANAKGKLAAAEAKLKRLNADFARAEQLKSDKAISQEEYDKVVGDRAETTASVEALKAEVEQAKLDLDYTKVTAPISGRISRKLVTEGNLIAAGQTGATLLTDIVSVDPVYVYFDVDERTVQQVRKLIREGKAKSARDVKIPLRLGLATDEGFPYEGTADFVDNKVNPKTGTLRLRGVFPSHGEILSPGYFARVRIPIGFPHKAVLITDRAIDTDQGQKIVYVVGQDNKVGRRAVVLGARHDGLRVIDDGLKAGDRIIVTGLQQVRSGMTVEPSVVDMPISNPEPETRNPKQTELPKSQ